jgi:hypothetical protein
MESMRATWTDLRLDEFANRTDRRFDDLEHRMDVGFTRVDHDFREIRAEIGALQRTIIQIGGGVIAAVLGLMAAITGLIATQL